MFCTILCLRILNSKARILGRFYHFKYVLCYLTATLLVFEFHLYKNESTFTVFGLKLYKDIKVFVELSK
jgi:hypothetical protein